MVKLTEDEIREIIKPVGLSPMKSKGIYGLSKILIEKYNGEVPKDFEALESLPAVGHKTASVVMSQAFGIPARITSYNVCYTKLLRPTAGKDSNASKSLGTSLV